MRIRSRARGHTPYQSGIISLSVRYYPGPYFLFVRFSLPIRQVFSGALLPMCQVFLYPYPLSGMYSPSLLILCETNHLPSRTRSRAWGLTPYPSGIPCPYPLSGMYSPSQLMFCETNNFPSRTPSRAQGRTPRPSGISYPYPISGMYSLSLLVGWDSLRVHGHACGALLPNRQEFPIHTPYLECISVYTCILGDIVLRVGAP